MKPSQRAEVVGKKPQWELWAESEVKADGRGQELLDKGGFTAQDLRRKTGWTICRCRNHLAASGLKWETAKDPRVRGTDVRFYLPPGVNP